MKSRRGQQREPLIVFAARKDVLTCAHEWDDDGHKRPTLGTTGAGVVCTDCGMLLTCEELAEYMRGEPAEDT